ncbi:MAG TPA: ABC transporter substrate-binding protein [Hyphomicrobiaceae bacterium]|nr:ABC transporter substrate-binding protein [Hyphomicrobiaceae bacterium]
MLSALSVPAPAAAQEGRLVLYTSQPNTDAQQTIAAFKAKFPKVDIVFVRDGTPRIMAKLRAEIAAGGSQADVLLIADSVTMEGLKAEGLLLAHPKADIAAYPAGLHDKDRYWFATKLITTGIIYNRKAPKRVASWNDLKSAESKGQVVMPSPLASGAALIHAASLVAALPAGWGYYEALKGNGAVAASGNGDVLKQVATGEKLYGVIVDFMALREKAKGAPIEFVFPTEGVSAISEPVAVLKSTKNPAAALAFIDFILSTEGQTLARSQGYYAARPGIAPPDGYPPISGVRILPLDPAAALASARENAKRFADIFGQ